MSLYAKLLIILAGIVLGFMGGWRVNDWRHASNERDRLQAQQAEQLAIAKRSFSLQEKRDADIARTESDLAAARRELRNRAAVRLPETPAACAGASPGALAAEDAEVALGYGAEFDRLRANYALCREFAYPVK
jgi:hypothetical protein